MFDLADDTVLAELRALGSIEELQQRLLFGGVGNGPARPEDPVALFCHFHESDPAGAAGTAFLLATCWHWNRCCGEVIARIEASGILSDADLDDLARRLLGPKKPDFVFPARWLADHFGDVDFAANPSAAVRSERSSAPALRRWAAIRSLRRGDVTVGRVLVIARQLRDGDRWAVISAALDVADTMAGSEVERVVEAALSSGRGHLRLRALRLLTDRGQRERALELARGDGDAKVRRWAQKYDENPVRVAGADRR